VFIRYHNALKRVAHWPWPQCLTLCFVSSSHEHPFSSPLCRRQVRLDLAGVTQQQRTKPASFASALRGGFEGVRPTDSSSWADLEEKKGSGRLASRMSPIELLRLPTVGYQKQSHNYQTRRRASTAHLDPTTPPWQTCCLLSRGHNPIVKCKNGPEASAGSYHRHSGLAPFDPA